MSPAESQHDPGRPRILEQLFALTVLLGDYMDDDLATRGLTRARARIAWRLYHQGGSTQRALADALGVSSRNVTGLVDALEADGFVSRRPHPSDRRAVLVVLTPRGQRTVAAMHRAEQGLEERLLGRFGPAERDQLAALLATVLESLRDAVAGGPHRDRAELSAPGTCAADEGPGPSRAP